MFEPVDITLREASRPERIVKRAEPLRTAVIGYGYWGPNLARNVAECPELALEALCDRDAVRRRRARESPQFPPAGRVRNRRDRPLRPGRLRAHGARDERQDHDRAHSPQPLRAHGDSHRTCAHRARTLGSRAA